MTKAESPFVQSTHDYRIEATGGKQKSNDITIQSAERLIELIQKIEKIKNPTVRAQMQGILTGRVKEIGRDISLLALPTLPPAPQPNKDAPPPPAPPTVTGTALTTSTSSALPKPPEEQK